MTDHSYRWLILGYTLVLQAVTVGAIIYCFSLFAVPWLEEFDAPRADVMLAISLLQVSFGLVSPFVGTAMDRLRMRTIVLTGSAFFGLGWLALSQATALWQIVLIYALVFPVAMTTMGTLASQTLITRWFSEQRGLAIGLSAMGTNLGGIILPLLVAPVLATGVWRETAFVLMGAGLIAIVPLTWFVLRRPSPGDRGTEKQGSRLPTREVLGSRTFLITVAGLIPLNLTFGAVQFNLGAFAADLGFAAEAGFLIALCSVCMVLGKFFFGALGDRLDHRLLFALAVLTKIAAMFLLLGTPDWPRLLVGVTAVGLAGGALLPVMGLIVGARFALEHFGRVMGLVMLSLSVASLGPLLAGWIFDATGSYDAAFLLFAGLMVPGLIAMIWLPKPQL